MTAKKNRVDFDDNQSIPPHITYELLTKYLENECTKDEKEVIDQWYDSYDANPNVVPAPDEKEEDINLKMFLNIRKRLGKNSPENTIE
ncbi:hypothetical protein [Larkinella terrae]|uniref:Uncharacterized protein n=1 Tax=Larkinella terrae TaxID=2025311 RepID=A0A7K0EMU1_9BACT|nr:hypothetical protein [Larkinella terrae]MRS63032.1 hypothetical protein [Larkinella terrae]